MIEWLSEWLRQIVIVVIIATCLDLLLPNQSLTRYVKLVMGLIIIMVILTPIYQLFRQKLNLAIPAFETVISKEQVVAFQDNREQLKAEQQAAIKNRAEQLLQQTITAQLHQKFGVEVLEAAVAIMEQGTRVQSVRLLMRPTPPEPLAREPTTEPIKPVDIRLPADNPVNPQVVPAKLTQSIVSYLVDAWQVSKDQIKITWD